MVSVRSCKLTAWFEDRGPDELAGFIPEQPVDDSTRRVAHSCSASLDRIMVLALDHYTIRVRSALDRMQGAP